MNVSMPRRPLAATLLLAVCALPALAAAKPNYADYARLLDDYVVDGQVRYEAWSKTELDLDILDNVLARFAEVDPAALASDERKAFYINLYNAAMVRAVLDAWPVDSVADIGPEKFSVFKQPFIELQGDRLSLDDVEKGILLETFDDPRIHFAVNCASASCPPLIDEPYRGEGLDALLDERTRAFARSRRAARVDRENGEIRYSALFKWYPDDFGVDNPAAYLNRYRDDALPLDYTVAWIPYDWSVNAAGGD